MTDVTHILCQIEQGDPNAIEQLLPLVYEELRRLAGRRMARENPGQTLQATALVHEAYLRLVGESREGPWRGRRQFFAAAAEAMRRILVEKARQKRSLKRGGELQRHSLEDVEIETRRPPEEILALHDALNRLANIDSTKADLVKLRYFAGLTVAEAAEVLEISPSSVDRMWAYARAWLHQEMTKGDASR